MNANKRKEFSTLWKLCLNTWPTVNKDERKRETLELLCAALWHIQKAYELGNISRLKLKSLIPKRVGGKTPWQVWVESREWFNSDKTDLNPTIQSMFITNAALRLDGVREIMRDNSKLSKKKDFKNTVLPNRIEMESWFSDPSFPSKKPNILGQVAIVEAFRDVFMHGETDGTTSYPKYIHFRQNTLRDYNLSEIAKYCLEVLCRFLELVPHLGNPKTFVLY